MMYKVGMVIITVCMLPGCIGSRSKKPQHAMPQSFDQQQCAGTSEEGLVRWWEQFEDPYLNDLLQTAVMYNYKLAQAVEKTEESRALYQFQKAELFPQLNGIATVRTSRFSSVLAQTSFLPNNRVSFFQLGFDGFWEIDFWGKIWREKKARYYDLQAQVEQMHDVYLVLIADVVRTYVDVCTLQQISAQIAEQIAIQEHLVSLQQDLYRSGLQSDIVVARQKQRLMQSKDRFESIQIQRIQAKNKLAVLLGMNPEQLAMPSRMSVPLSAAQLNTGLPSELLQRRPDIRQKERMLAAANQRVGQAISEWFPSFRLLGGLTSDTSKRSEWFSSGSLSWNIGPSINWPVINFGRIKATIEGREASERQAALAYSETIIRALQEVEDFLVAYFKNGEQLHILHDKVLYGNQEASLQYAKLTSGLTDELTYLEAKNSVIEVQIEQTFTKQALSTNLISLYKALGGGW